MATLKIIAGTVYGNAQIFIPKDDAEPRMLLTRVGRVSTAVFYF